MLSIHIERLGSTALLRCTGRMVVGERLSTLKDAVLCELDKRAIILDLAGIRSIDAGGLGLLVFLHVCTHGLGAELHLQAPSAQVANLLQVTRLDSVFTIHSAPDTGADLAPVSRGNCCQACA